MTNPPAKHCDYCDWTFTCWTGMDACRKIPYPSPAKPEQHEPGATPRTDSCSISQLGPNDCLIWTVPRSLARQLETELVQARRRIAELEKTLDESLGFVAKYSRELSVLGEQNARLQAIADAAGRVAGYFNGPPGEPIEHWHEAMSALAAAINQP